MTTDAVTTSTGASSSLLTDNSSVSTPQAPTAIAAPAESQQHSTTTIMDDEIDESSTQQQQHQQQSGVGGDMQQNAAAATASKMSIQLKRLTEANTKYKNLLKLAKERIQKQEEEVDILRQQKQSLEERIILDEKEAAGRIAIDETTTNNDKVAESEMKIVNVLRRIHIPIMSDNNNSTNTSNREEIWALMEIEYEKENDTNNTIAAGPSIRRVREWKRFDTETQLQDYIRRDTGEPLHIPPYSLSPEQSASIEREAENRVAKITEEFRRFRVRSELARKQIEGQMKDLHNTHVQRATQNIGGHLQEGYGTSNNKSYESRQLEMQVEQLKNEMATKEIQWKQLYDEVVTENQALKSSGSDALIASQWRQRYEACLKEKQELEANLGPVIEGTDGAANFERKYRDLKESFRVYRKKAKEFFEAQQHNNAASSTLSSDFLINGGGIINNAMTASSTSSADAKLAYLKNLMKNYLESTNQSVRGHMEGAIVTVLEFSENEIQQMAKKKAESESWF